MQTIRTTNWNNMNKFVASKPKEPSTIEKKARIIRHIKKRYEQGLGMQYVIATGRRYGKTTLLTNWFTLCKLESAIIRNDRTSIKQIINERINSRVRGYYGIYGNRRTFKISPINIRV